MGALVSTPLLQTKLHVPPPHTGGGIVQRDRLLARLDAAQRSGHRLILVSAPAGSGKTTLISTWIAQRQLRAAWVSLDAADNDVARFWTYVFAALESVDPGLGDVPRQALQSPQPPPVSSLLTVLLNDLSAVGEPLTLVLDDFHVIENARIHAGVAFLLAHQPASLRLVGHLS
jgi:LuxR family maltose regulon positive regulatory protein